MGSYEWSVICRVAIIIAPVKGKKLITKLITTHEPPSRVALRIPRGFVLGLGGLRVSDFGFRIGV